MSFSKLSSEILEKFGDLSDAKLNVPVLMNFVDFLQMFEHLRMFSNVIKRKQAGGGGGVESAHRLVVLPSSVLKR